MSSESGLGKYRPHFLSRVLTLAAVIALLAGALVGAAGDAGTLTASLPESDGLFVPAEYGRIVYQKNGHSPRQIFIIAQSHRSAITGQTRPDIVKAQAEIYRIGEWLIREQKVGLLLPEGFFQRAPGGNLSPADAAREGLPLDSQTLEAELSDTRRFVNADLLLNASYPVCLGQVEDERLYRDINRLLCEARQGDSLSVLSELAGLQNERTAAMLQNIPEVVEEAFRTDRIENRKAMFTIGLAHVGDIVDLLRRGSLSQPAAKAGAPQGETRRASLKLLDQGYGVTVIVPTTLAENEQVLRLSRLEAE